jgi:hypothetical protein
MKNELAIKLVAAADEYRAVERNLRSRCARLGMPVSSYEGAAEVVQSDYEDLIRIAGMIENNESKKSIANAMWNLDTLVRDVIPDKVYYYFNK